MTRAKFANIRPGYVPRVKVPKPYKPKPPLEHAEAKAFMQWVRLNEAAHPELRWLFAVPNGGHRNKVAAGKAKAEGARKGVPDYQMPVRFLNCPGLVIELKRVSGGAVSAEQKEWLAHYSAQGWVVHRCNGSGEAINAMQAYIKLLRFKNPQAMAS